MGFGNYDETEHEKKNKSTSDMDIGETRSAEEEHKSKIQVEGADDTESLIQRLQDMGD